MRVGSTITLILWYAMLLLVGVIVQVPDHGTLLLYVASKLGFWTGIMTLVFLIAPVVLLIMTQYQTNRIQEHVFENQKLNDNAQKLISTLSEIGRFQVDVSRRAANARHDAETLESLEAMGQALRAAETDAAAAQQLLADPNQYKILIDSVRERQAAVIAKLKTVEGILTPLTVSTNDINEAQTAVEELLESFGGADEIVALSGHVAAAEKFANATEPLLAQVASCAAPAKAVVARLEACKDRIEALSDSSDGVPALVESVTDLLKDVERQLRRAEFIESGEPIGQKLIAADATATEYGSRIAAIELTMTSAQTLRAKLEQSRAKTSFLNDEQSPKKVFGKIDEIFRAIDAILRAASMIDGVPISELVIREQGRVDGLTSRLSAYEANYGLVTKLLAGATNLEARLGVSQPNGDART